MLLLVLTNCVLAFMVVTFTEDLSRIRKQAATQQSEHAINDRVAGMELPYSQQDRSAGVQGRSVSELEMDLKRLEEATFGTGPSGFEYDAMGDLEDRGRIRGDHRSVPPVVHRRHEVMFEPAGISAVIGQSFVLDVVLTTFAPDAGLPARASRSSAGREPALGVEVPSVRVSAHLRVAPTISLPTCSSARPDDDASLRF